MSVKIIPINTRREPVIYLDRLPYLDINALRKIIKITINVLPLPMFYHKKPP